MKEKNVSRLDSSMTYSENAYIYHDIMYKINISSIDNELYKRNHYNPSYNLYKEVFYICVSVLSYVYCLVEHNISQDQVNINV